MFNTFIYTPLYNLLVGIIDILPGESIFLGVLVVTIIVKLILLPLTKKSIITQIKSRQIQSELTELKEKYKDNREMLGMKMMELYKKHKINPFSSIFLILIQLPIIFALFFILSRSGFPEINNEILYSFVPYPETVNTSLLGIDLAQKSWIFAFLAAFTQFLYMKRILVMPKKEGEDKNQDAMQKTMDNLTKAINTQMIYVMPVIILFAGYGFSAVVALYWTISNIITYLQDIYVKSHARKLGILEE